MSKGQLPRQLEWVFYGRNGKRWGYWRGSDGHSGDFVFAGSGHLVLEVMFPTLSIWSQFTVVVPRNLWSWPEHFDWDNMIKNPRCGCKH